ncbi:Alpha-2-macroglobulin, N-terminal:Alpha-2-macroglobulin, N-terminal 2 [Candidatus Accumulibacter aalborgensis]|uniref:Alpha-2-macroglobulin, N-terminal:Alpha-2-macroglobulin, N-terminal 2 n=1 Tax=Candidatus Accumulibacter aalborgensis TaxID=1860102 RepID=A0A1A8XLN6_9PROT|nr:alpha-2-macroglobulin [Candidatus Accumulibacter aalborgensis]SBT06060.1 Alpha-2-macroglobulin, N-terminal:Alpha-2-macroglobulin, N-terminal 2 [Candidatus Accumulibacter aalborgensis]
MRFERQIRQRGVAPMVAIIGAVVLAIAGFLAIAHFPQKGQDEPATEGIRFELIDGAHRDLDGSPALALSFSLPLDARGDYDKSVQVLEMPAAPQLATPHARDAEEGDEQDSGAAANMASSTSRAAADTALEGGQPVAGAWVVGENPRLLFFPHIKPQTRYVVRVQAGLTARNGSKLEEEARFSIRTAAVAPAFYFASRGMVLPAAQNGGLPVTTVNVPEVDIQFLKVKPDQLAKFLEKVVAGPVRATPAAGEANADGEEGDDYASGTHLKGAVGSWELDQLHKLTTSAFVGRFLTEQKANRRSVTFIPVETLPALREPGVYVAVMSQPNRFRDDYQTTYFYVSDLGLHLRQYANRGADAYVSSLTDGKAQSGVEVSWIDGQGKTLARGESDHDGRVTFAEKPNGARVVMARKGEQMSLIALKEPALDLAEFDITGMPYVPVRLFAYSGRNLYRPGERFEVSVMARDADGRPVPPQPVQAILRRPDGKAQWTATWQPDEGFAGYYRRAVELPSDAATGSWSLELRADPAAKLAGTSMPFAVEEFLPERMKLDLATASERLAGDSGWQIDVSGAYLYGAPAAGNRLLGVLTSERSRNPLAQKLPGFIFGDADEETVKSRSELPEIQLDEQGKAKIAVSVESVAKRRSPFTVRATLSLLESGGRPVVRNIERVWWPAPVLVGLRPLFVGAYAREGAPADFEVVRADVGGALKAGTALPVRLFRENRSYYWRFDDQRGWNSGFTETDELVSTTQVSVPAGGRGKLSLPVKYGRYRVEILDPESRQTMRFRFYAGWSAKDDETQGVRPDRVALKFDKPAYADGDTVRLTISPPHAGEALVTVEGDRALWVRRLAIGADGTTIDIPLDKEWQRHDLYVSVMVLRPGNRGEKVTPARALGLLHVPLDRAKRKLDVALEAPQKMEPEQPLKVRIRVPEARGQKAMVTLSAVDVGILNVTRFASPDPFAFFFAKLRYGADAYDIYGRLIEKMDGQKGKLKFGGDAAPKPTRSVPKKVRLVDLFSGPVALDDQGEAEISLPVPDFNGSLRLMAVVASSDRFGMQEAEVTVAAPLVVELATPRFLSVGDSAVLALDVHNLSAKEQEIKVAISNGDGLRIKRVEQPFSLKAQQKRILRIPIEAGTAIGLSEVQVRVDSPLIKIKRSFALQVQAPTPRQSVVKRLVVAPGETVEVRDAELAGFLRETVAATLVVSDKAPIDVRSAVQGLLAYPYGCAEQTISSAYPQLFIDEAAARQFGLKPFTKAQRAELVDKAIARVAGMQAANGGFSLWGNLSEYQYWLSAYVANFLLDAREQGFNVPPEVDKRALDFLLKGLQEGVAGLPTGPVAYNQNAVWNDNRYAGSGRFAVLAYGAYVLARQGKAPLATLRQLHESQAAAHSGLALVQLGLALKLMGDEARAESAIAAGMVKPRGGPGQAWWGDYGSNLRDWAMIYVLLDKYQLKPPGRENLVSQVAGEMENRRYYSTQEKLALFLLGRSFVTDAGGEWAAEIVSADKPQPIGGRGAQFRPLSASEVAAGIKIRNTYKDRLFVELSFTGNPVRMPAARRDVFDLKRDWFTADGQPLGNRALRVGETAIVRLQVKTAGRYANGLIVDYIPAGLEIENVNIVQGEQSVITVGGVDPRQVMQNSDIRHVEFRDDRFVVAARLARQMQFFYRVRVVTPGRFVVPPTYAEDMYQPQIYGLAGGDEMLLISDGSKDEDAGAKK